MATYFDNGKSFPNTTAGFSKLVGKKIKFVRKSDIDNSGRGYFFPQTNTIVRVYNRKVEFANGAWESFSSLVEYEEIDNERRLD